MPKTPISFWMVHAMLSSVLIGAVLVNIYQEWGFPDTRFQIGKDEKIRIEEIGVTQTFIASRNGLSGVNVLFGGSKIKNGGTLQFRLQDSICDKTLHSEDRFITAFESDNTKHFSFERVSHSQGDTFCIRIGFIPEIGSKKGNIFIMKNPLSKEFLELTTGGTPRPEYSLAFRPVYQNKTFFADLAELNDRISQYKPWFLKGYLLTTLTCGAFGFSFLFLVLAIVLSHSEDNECQKRPNRNKD